MVYELDKYFIKVYDNCRQTKGRVPEKTLRTELVFTKAAPLQKLGIYSLLDLIDEAALLRLRKTNILTT